MEVSPYIDSSWGNYYLKKKTGKPLALTTSSPYNWKLTSMIHSKRLTPSVSKCPSPLGLEFLLRERFGGF